MMNFSSIGIGTGIGFGGWFGFHLHMMFCVLTFIGVILFIAWAVKHLKKKQLGTLVAWVIGVGIVGMLLTSLFGFGGFNRYGGMHDFDNMDEWGVGGLSNSENFGEQMLEEMEEHMGELEAK